MTISVKINNLSKYFGKFPALNNLNLEVNEGEIFGLLGPNGAGKTTTIKLMTGLLKPTNGNVLIKDIDIQVDPINAKKKFALLPDVPYLYEKLTGWEFMKFIAKVYALDRNDLDSDIEKQLKIFNVNEVSYDLIESYSHGLRQRLLLASVMLRDPEVIILDEPMVGLDPQAARMVKDIFKNLIKRKRTIFLSTHTLTDAQELCSRIAIIDKGKLLALGDIQQLKKIASDLNEQEGLSLISDDLEEIYLSITRNA